MPGYLSEAFVSFQGEGLHVGRRHLFLRFAGCPLRCRYCDTPESLTRTDQFVVRADEQQTRHNPVSLGDISWAIDLLTASAGPIDGVAITGGEPLAQVDFLSEVLRMRDLPSPRLLETSGTQPDQLRQVIDVIDIVSMDIKLPSNTGETSFWNEHRRFLQLAAGRAYVKILIDSATSPDDLQRAVDMIAETAPETSVFLQPITPRNGGTSLGLAGISAFYDLARGSIRDVRVLPQTHKILKIW